MQALEREARSAAYQRVPEGDARMKELNAVIGKYRMGARNQGRLKNQLHPQGSVEMLLHIVTCLQ